MCVELGINNSLIEKLLKLYCITYLASDSIVFLYTAVFFSTTFLGICLRTDRIWMTNWPVKNISWLTGHQAEALFNSAGGWHRPEKLSNCSVRFPRQLTDPAEKVRGIIHYIPEVKMDFLKKGTLFKIETL